MFDVPNPLLNELRDALDRHRVAVRTIGAGDRLQGGDGCSIEVLHPPRRGVLGSTNANSLVLAVECFGHRILLTGDIEPPGLDDLLAEEPLHCEVLLAPHHGSRQSNSPQLAAWCRPQWVVLSGDGRWNAADIEASYRAVGGRVLQTSDRGAIRVRIAADGVQVFGFVEPPRPSQRNTTISPGERNRGWRKITFNRPGNAAMISCSCRSVAMTYDRPPRSRNAASSFNASVRLPSQRVTGPRNNRPCFHGRSDRRRSAARNCRTGCQHCRTGCQPVPRKAKSFWTGCQPVLRIESSPREWRRSSVWRFDGDRPATRRSRRRPSETTPP